MAERDAMARIRAAEQEAERKAERSGRLLTEKNEEIIDLDDLSRTTTTTTVPRRPINAILDQWGNEPAILAAKRLLMGREGNNGYLSSALASAGAIGALGGTR